jgi:hypothetical protein
MFELSRELNSVFCPESSDNLDQVDQTEIKESGSEIAIKPQQELPLTVGRVCNA